MYIPHANLQTQHYIFNMFRLDAGNSQPKMIDLLLTPTRIL